ncbi:tripartite tricarboxylate transporter substrate binding protein [Xenophilus sp. Marseille-Q4582]|uniref:Bug family tripartite tricarboxylate transporter substrate binding protein n=1 Tax=Xenophilus sp. Marseille-Q4582 TaxID=2866600 RepID=UPI001CE4000F|nr:tripartite tricarboxylate transporter substrate binding protein [Xenophilus sp. Marseille-Q4582]
MNQLTRRSATAAAAALMLGTGLLAAGTAQAQAAWPAKTITLVVAYPAGGDTDAMARTYAEKLGQRLGQAVVVDNRPGATGTLGAGYVAKAPADGYTLLFAPSTFAIAPLVLKGGVPMDVNKDFTPITQVGASPLLLLASTQSGLKDVKSLVAQVKGGKDIAYGSSGSGSPMHIVGEMFNKAAGIKMTHVPYKGIAPGLADLLGGHLPTVYATPGAAAGYLADKKVVPLAVTGQGRSPILPEVPSLVELGYKDVDVTAWWGLFGPKGVPAEVVKKIEATMQEVIKMPDVVAKLNTMAVTPEIADGAALGRTVANDHARFGKVIKEFGIQAD